MCDCGLPDETGLRNRMLFRATPDDITKGEPIMKEALKEGEATSTYAYYISRKNTRRLTNIWQLVNLIHWEYVFMNIAVLEG